MAERLIAEGSHGRVFVEGKRVRKEAQEDEGQPLFNPLQSFWAHKIAGVLFPGTVLQFDLARRKVGEKPAIVASRLVKTTPQHKAFVKWLAGKKEPSFAQDALDWPAGAAQHFKRVHSKDAHDAIASMISRGIFADLHPSNIDFINGKPFFFEVDSVDPFRLKQAIASHPKRKLLEKYLERHEKARRTPSVYKPK